MQAAAVVVAALLQDCLSFGSLVRQWPWCDAVQSASDIHKHHAASYWLETKRSASEARQFLAQRLCELTVFIAALVLVAALVAAMH